MTPFSFLYYSFALIIYIISIPFLLILSIKKRYRLSLPSRYFLRSNPPFKREGVWFHCCSLGETKSIKPFVKHFSKDYTVNISVTTNTAYHEAKHLSSCVRFLPYEIFLPFWIYLQKLLVVMEAELWYMLFLIAHKHQTPTVLLNARISDRAFSSYQRFQWLYKRIFTHIDYVFAQTIQDKQRLQALGAQNVVVTGNIKLLSKPILQKNFTPNNRFTITAASTHEKEEELILTHYTTNMGQLIIVPRHPERFNEVEQLIKTFSSVYHFSYERYSVTRTFDADVVLFDQVGLLNDIYAISDLVILGGAFEPIGGHNPLEPAFFNCRIITGPHTFNQHALFDRIDHYSIANPQELNALLNQGQSLKPARIKQQHGTNTLLTTLSNCMTSTHKEHHENR